MESGDERPQLDESRYAEIVGKRAERYLPRFRRFAKGEWLSWNWAAFFGTLAWLRYRRLYRWSWLYFFVSTPMLIIWSLLPSAADACQAALNPATEYIAYGFEALIAASWIVPPLFADRLYFNEVRRLAASNKRPPPAGAGAIAAALALQVLVPFVVASSIAGREGYVSRAKVSEGILLANAARTPVYEYFLQHHALPPRLEGIASTTGEYVSKIELVDRGTIRVTFNERTGRVAGHTISVVPTWKDEQIVSWSCGSTDLPTACLPFACRAQP